MSNGSNAGARWDRRRSSGAQ
uniref:Uncharacterized protein n=1 Tax=Arundo donax TaxID=35708 RepID=A0A0A9BTD9_ARUDO